ncbi:DUF2397 family protein [Streptomyces sp. NPDC007971]|uniref:DUF2397 family protein n=1 Tax=Streptomyces sp. NPDC007971 TaxID=3364799 RepID=UPI0036DFB671
MTSSDYSAFAHLTAPNAPLYRQVMRAFLAAKERFAVHLRPEDVYAALDAGSRPADPEAVTARFTDLADNARAFMGSLQRTIDLHDIEVEAFLAYKDRLIQYLERFIQDPPAAHSKDR